MKFVLQCAWCKKMLGTKEDPNDDAPDAITHTICPICSATVLVVLE